MDDIVDAGGWADPLAVHSVTGRWAEIVGETVAAHTEVISFRDGVVVVGCDSTSWATQMRMLVPALLERLASEIGPGVVTSVEVRGPQAPSWVRGPRRVRGRGPRDTYG
jgi:predicted nucleic acid-binding Zn ribbon protein